MRNTFKKEERLCSKSEINSLFHSGSSFVIYPFRIVFSCSKVGAFETKVILSVSKRIFKRAHDRNRIKRLMREVYRMQKSKVLYPFIESKEIKLHFAIQYISKEELPFVLLEAKMVKVLNQVRNLCDA